MNDPATSAKDCSPTYRNSLELAVAHDCAAVAFPNISTGAYRYPKREAAEVAITAVTEWIGDNPAIDEVLFVCFDQENLRIYNELLGGS